MQTLWPAPFSLSLRLFSISSVTFIVSEEFCLSLPQVYAYIINTVGHVTQFAYLYTIRV